MNLHKTYSGMYRWFSIKRQIILAVTMNFCKYNFIGFSVRVKFEFNSRKRRHDKKVGATH